MTGIRNPTGLKIPDIPIRYRGISNRQEMLKDQNIPGLLPDAFAAALRRLDVFSPRAVYVFGSVATGTARPDSDIDIALLAEQPLDAPALFTMAGDLEDIFARPVDLLDLSRSSTVMAKQVIVTGRLILDANPRLRQEWEMLVLSNYARLNEERQPVLATLGISPRAAAYTP